MNLFHKRNTEKEYQLWHNWRVTLSSEYDRIENDDSGQLINADRESRHLWFIFYAQGASIV